VSREVFGDAPVSEVSERADSEERLRGLAAALRASRQALLPGYAPATQRQPGRTPPPGSPEPSESREPSETPEPSEPETREPRERDRRRLPAAATAAALVLVVTGWTAYSATEPPGDPARGVVAAVTGATAASTDAASRRALITITVANPGKETVTVTGYAYTTRSSAALGVDEPTAHVAPGERVELTVDVALDCARAAPLLLPDLVIEAEDGGRRQVATVGAVAALMSICTNGPDEGHPLTVLGARRDGDDLLVHLASPSNRRTDIRTVRATGQVLDVAPLPTRVDRRGTELRLKPLPTCPSAWREDGIPQNLDVELDAGGPATIVLKVGKPLATWALDVVCREVT
jgi:hypothetical protein